MDDHQNSDSMNFKRFKDDKCHCKNDESVYVCFRCLLSCCNKAREMNCICLYSFICEEHHPTQKCHGSHS